MTLIAACRFENEGVVLADSRATWSQDGTHQDQLQKILPLAPRLALAFAGDVRTASTIAEALRRQIGRSPRLSNPRCLADYIPRVARYVYSVRDRTTSADRVELLLLTAPASGGPLYWRYSSANDFVPAAVEEAYTVFGSGSAVARSFEREVLRLETHTGSLKEKATHLVRHVYHQLNALAEASVGGLLQAFILDDSGIRPLSYGFTTLHPDKSPRAKEMEAVKGGWLQRDLPSNVTMELADPGNLQVKPALDREFHSYVPSEDEAPTCHLTLLLLCNRISADLYSTDIEQGSGTLIASAYPLDWRQLILLGLWSTKPRWSLSFQLIGQNSEIPAGEFELAFTYSPIQEQVLVRIQARVPEPGVYFLVVRADGNLVARKPLIFGISDTPSSTQAPVPIWKRVSAELSTLNRNLAETRDPQLSLSLRCGLEYFCICQEVQLSPPLLRLGGAPIAVYSNAYPLMLPYSLGLQTRLPRGVRHKLLFEAVSAFTGVSVPFGETELLSESDTVPVQIHHEGVLRLDEPGWYFINVRANGDRLATLLLAAETANGKWSLALTPADRASVEQGQLLLVGQNQVVRPRELHSVVV